MFCCEECCVVVRDSVLQTKKKQRWSRVLKSKPFGFMKTLMRIYPTFEQRVTRRRYFCALWIFWIMMLQMFESCPILSPSQHMYEELLAQFKSHVGQVSVFGAILLTPCLKKCFMGSFAFFFVVGSPFLLHSEGIWRIILELSEGENWWGWKIVSMCAEEEWSKSFERTLQISITSSRKSFEGSKSFERTLQWSFDWSRKSFERTLQ